MDGKSLRAALVGSLLLCVLLPASASADYRRWYLNNGTDGIGEIAVNYGDTSQTPIVGDWDGNGTDTPGVYQVSTARWWLANTFNGTTQAYFQYGDPGFAPVVGDWDGNRTRTVGAIRLPNRWYLSNVNGPVVGSIALTFGGTGDTMLTGDWNGDGKETVGVYHRANGQFWLSNANTGACCDKVFVFGNIGDVPLVGDWNGDGIDTIGVYRSSASGARWFLNNQNDSSVPELSFYYGNPGDTPVIGDWNGDGKDTPGVVRTFVTPPAPPWDPYPTSTRFGGANGVIDTPSESAAFVHAIDATPIDGTDALWNGMTEPEQRYVEDVDDAEEEFEDQASAAFSALDSDPDADFGAAEATDVDEDPDPAAVGEDTVEAAAVPPPPDPDNTRNCGRQIREKTSIFNTYRVKFRRKGKTAAGDTFYQYHVHFQITLPFRPFTVNSLARTHMRGYGTKPDGFFSKTWFNDSDARRNRGDDWKPYYAHFTMKVKPGSKLSVYAHTRFDPQPRVGNVIVAGVHLRRDRSACWAKFS